MFLAKMHVQNVLIPPSVLRAFDLNVSQATSASGGFSGAEVFRATSCDGREFAIRRTPISVALPSERMHRLHGLLREISQSGCRIVPVPLLTAGKVAQGPETSLKNVASWFQLAENIWQIEPWMPGSSCTGDELTAAQLRVALVALDQFHQLATAAVNAIGANDWFMNAQRPSPAVLRRLKIVDELQSGLATNLYQRLRHDPDAHFRGLAVRVCESLTTWLPWLQQQLSGLALTAFPIQPVLRDVWRAHVLFSGGHVSGLIDLSAAASDHVTVDITRLIRSWFGADSLRVQNAIQDYRSLRFLSPIEQRLLQALDASTVLLSPVTWLRRRLESGDTRNCRADVVARLTELTLVAETFRPLSFE